MISAVPDRPLAVVGYVRVSQAREEMVSPELQRTAIEDYCHRRGLVLVDVVEDLDATGRNFARVGVQSCIGRVEDGEVAGIVVWKFSRFGRNRRDWAINLDRVESVGGALLSATEEIDTRTSTGRLTRGMLAEIAAWESERIGEQWQESHARRRSMGLPHSGGPRFGYTYSKADGYKPDPATAPLLADAYRAFIAGATARSIAARWNAAGVRTTTGGQWQRVSLFRVLDSGFAAGLISRPRTTGEYLPGAHEPIITRAEWDAYLAARRLRRGAGPHTITVRHSLAGLVRCAACGGALSRSAPKTRPSHWFRCARDSQGQVCPNPVRAASADRIEAAVAAWLLSLSGEVDARAAVKVAQRSRAAVVKTDRARLAREVARLDAALTRLTVDLASGLVPAGAYASARDELTRQREVASAALDHTTADVAALRRPVTANLTRDWPDMDAQARHDVLVALVERIDVERLGRGQYETRLTTRWGEVVSLVLP